MSSSWGLVRFPDGTVLVGKYHGTSDIFVPELLTIDEWRQGGWEALDALGHGPNSWDGRQRSDEERAADEADQECIEAAAVGVDIYADYGGGTHWRGRANLAEKLLVEGLEWGTIDQYGPRGVYTGSIHVPYENGTPEWAAEVDMSR